MRIKKKAVSTKPKLKPPSIERVLGAREARLAKHTNGEVISNELTPDVANSGLPFATTGVPLGTRAVGKRWGKYNARTCVDEEGIVYHSMLEREALMEIRALQRQGFIKNLKTQSECAYNFGDIKLPHGKLKRKYLPDAAFDCLKEFTMTAINGPIHFLPGNHYVVDIKSPPTAKNEMYKMKKELMWCFFGVRIIEIIRRPPRKTVNNTPKGSRKRKK